MTSFISKTDILNKNLFICVFLFILVSYSNTSNAQEKEDKTKTTEEAIEEAEIIEILEKTPELLPFSVLEDVPYPTEGCKGLNTNDERKKCVVKFIQKHVARKFNTDLSDELGLESGRKRILIQFKIDKSGKIVDVHAKGPHLDLEKEAERVINLLPEFTPGKRYGKPVVVAYNLPLVFTIVGDTKEDDKQ